jgi:hypothetical protein
MCGKECRGKTGDCVAYYIVEVSVAATVFDTSVVGQKFGYPE